MNKPLVSIVVPVYNAELYIKKCIDSLIMQTYENLEIIAIDDGSLDRSLMIMNEYAKSDSRLKVIHQENQGASLAREKGLMLATGSYVMFIDGDDWIDSDTIACCIQTAMRNESDCVIFSYVKEYGNKKIENPLFEGDFFYTVEEAEENIHRRLIGLIDEELQHPERIDNLSSFCMKLYRLEKAKKGRFVSERIVGTSEDTFFNLYALENCSVSYINRCFYHYRKTNEQSITTCYKMNLPQKWDVLYELFEEYIVSSGKENYKKAFLNRVACGTIGLGLNEISNSTSILKKAKEIQSILNRPLYQEAFRKLDYSACPPKWKVFFILCKWKRSFLLTALLTTMNHLRSRIAG